MLTACKFHYLHHWATRLIVHHIKKFWTVLLISHVDRREIEKNGANKQWKYKRATERLVSFTILKLWETYKNRWWVMLSNGNESSDFLSAPAKLIVLRRFNRHLIEHSIDVGRMDKRKNPQTFNTRQSSCILKIESVNSNTDVMPRVAQEIHSLADAYICCEAIFLINFHFAVPTQQKIWCMGSFFWFVLCQIEFDFSINVCSWQPQK